MIKSMTGYGKAEGTVGNRKYTVEMRALNSKQLDLNLRMPSVFKEGEMALRNSLSRTLVRGKIDVTIYFEADATEKKVSINKSLMESYHADLKEVAENIGQQEVDYMGLMIRIPEVLRPEREEFDKEEWLQIKAMVEKAAANLDKYRSTEGKDTEDDLRGRVTSIRSLLEEAEEPLNQRMETIKSRIRTNLEEFIDPDKIDPNRFEQELIYFLEKLDISEERVRLSSNCDYFLEVLENGEAQGKKLGFISQEIGREINTMGSKANNAEVQRIVVKMKDELEKIKEQVLNVL
ncbi:MAG: YicC family protein [Flavobacteriales bacterium]|nr:YicC family protein [Flavobacteriales bacterium]